MKKKPIKGSVLLLAMIATAMATMTITSLLRYQLHYHGIQSKHLKRIESIYKARAGIQIVLSELTYVDDADRFTSSEWSTSGVPSGYTHKYTDDDGTIYYLNIQGL